MLVTASVRAVLPAAGAWDHLIRTSRWLLEELLERADRPTVKLLFVGQELFVDRLPIVAANLGAKEPFNSHRRRTAGTSNRWSFHLPEPGETKPGETKPSVGQIPARRWPLFGKTTRS